MTEPIPVWKRDQIAKLEARRRRASPLSDELTTDAPVGGLVGTWDVRVAPTRHSRGPGYAGLVDEWRVISTKKRLLKNIEGWAGQFPQTRRNIYSLAHP